MRGTPQFRELSGHPNILHAGIQYWDPDGSSGFIVEIVWFLRTGSSMSSPSCRLYNDLEVAATPSQLVRGGLPGTSAFISSSTSSTNSNESFTTNSLHRDPTRRNLRGDLYHPYTRCDAARSSASSSPITLTRMIPLIWHNDRLRPTLPRLQYKNTDLLPDDLPNLDRMDIPLGFYRRKRLLRALGGAASV